MKQEYVLDGLDCSNCARKIENGVKGIKGIDGCAVNFAASTLTVSADGKEEQWVTNKVEKKVKSIDPHVTVRQKHKKKSADDGYRNNGQYADQNGGGCHSRRSGIFGSFGNH